MPQTPKEIKKGTSKTINITHEAYDALQDEQTGLARKLGFKPTITQVILHLCNMKGTKDD